MLLTRTALFTPLDLKYRLFTKVPVMNQRERVFEIARFGNGGNGFVARQSRLRELAFQSSAAAQLVIDASGILALFNDRAAEYFNLAPRDAGRPLQDLELSYRPVELRSLIDRAYQERQVITVEDISRAGQGGQTQYLELQVVPLISDGDILGVSLLFADQTRTHKLQEDIQHSRHELETAYEELQSTNEELETTNEELQSTNEELETTNEELQSTNEELETMNEELQSTNEELQTMNDELRIRTDELNQSNANLASILGSIRAAVVLVDTQTHVTLWNDWAEDLWGLREAEVKGQSLLTLDIGLPVEQLAGPIRDCLARECEHRELLLDATNRRGKAFRCRISITPYCGLDEKIEGVVLLMSEDQEDIAHTVGGHHEHR